MPSFSSTDSVPFRRHDPTIAVSNLFGLSADTILSWNQRTPYPDWTPVQPVQLEAPTQAVLLPPSGIWKQMVGLHREVLEESRRIRQDIDQRPSRLFFGQTMSGREFMSRSMNAEAGLRFHRY